MGSSSSRSQESNTGERYPLAVEPNKPPTTDEILRSRFHQGVNLGSMFVLERWLVPGLFVPHNAVGHAELDAVAAAVKNVGMRATQMMMETHWRTWMAHNDWVWLKEIGVNSVRVPIGYWQLQGAKFCSGTPFEPYAAVYKHAWEIFVDCVLRKSAKYGMTVLVDLHGVPGGVNTMEHSGTSSGKAEFFDRSYYQAITLKLLVWLAKELLPYEHVSGLQIANETKYVENKASVIRFYSKAIKAIRKVNPRIVIVVPDCWVPKTMAQELWELEESNGCPLGLVMDAHIYRCYSNVHKGMDPFELIETLSANALLPEHPVDCIAGEFSTVLSEESWSKLTVIEEEEEEEPTQEPSEPPADGLTDGPTEAPIIGPTKAPIIGPTKAPIIGPTEAPTKTTAVGPTEFPTKAPADGPIKVPTKPPVDGEVPTVAPADGSNEVPTNPTDAPSKVPHSHSRIIRGMTVERLRRAVSRRIWRKLYEETLSISAGYYFWTHKAAVDVGSHWALPDAVRVGYCHFWHPKRILRTERDKEVYENYLSDCRKFELEKYYSQVLENVISEIDEETWRYKDGFAIAWEDSLHFDRYNHSRIGRRHDWAKARLVQHMRDTNTSSPDKQTLEWFTKGFYDGLDAYRAAQESYLDKEDKTVNDENSKAFAAGAADAASAVVKSNADATRVGAANGRPLPKR